MSELSDEARTEEHIFPESIGGALKLTELCVGCNSHLGRHVDAQLVDHRYIQWSRKHYKLAGKSGTIPNPCEKAYVAGDPSRPLRWDATGDIYAYPHSQETQTGDLIITVDRKDEKKLSAMVAKAKNRRGVNARGRIRPTDRDALEFELGFEATGYKFGIMKIAYELACLVLGSAYLHDPIAVRFRSVLQRNPPTDADARAAGLRYWVHGLYDGSVAPMAEPNDTCLIGLLWRHEAQAQGIVYVRLFDKLDASFLVTEQPHLYQFPALGRGWITDVQSRKTRETDYSEISAEWAAGFERAKGQSQDS